MKWEEINRRAQSQQGRRSLLRSRARTSAAGSRWDPELMLRDNRSWTLEIFAILVLSFQSSFSTIISELYYHTYLWVLSANRPFQELKNWSAFSLAPTLHPPSFICHSLQHKSNISPGTDNLQTLFQTWTGGPDKSEFFVHLFFFFSNSSRAPFHYPDIKHCSLAK